MIDARDRVLHYALKLVHQEQPVVDQTEEIRAAWERGVRGSGIPEEGPDEELLEERELVRAAARTLAVPTWLVAASVVAAAGLAVWTLGPRDPDRREDETAAVEPGPVGAGGAALASLTDEERVLFAKAFETATTRIYDWAQIMPVAAFPGEFEGPADELARLLAEKPAFWTELESRLLELIESAPEPPAVATRIVDLVAFDPSEAALSVARDLWLTAPEVFTEDHIVTLAERGLFEFEREVVARVALWAPDAPDVPILSATFLALRGDPDAVSFLLDQPQEEPKMVAQRDLAAAVALDFQGHPEPWSRIKGVVARDVEDALARGDVDMARMLALGLEFFHLARDEGDVLALGSLTIRAMRHYVKRMDEFQDPEDVRALIDSM